MDLLAAPEMTDGSLLRVLDEAPVTRYHWRTVITTGLGFFTDAYDLFIIGTVTVWLTTLWRLDRWELAAINSSALLTAVAGCLVFGVLMDRLGRRTMYGLEALLLTAGAILSALSTNPWMLILGRAIVGLGVGGDYPASAVIVSEFANRSHRGQLVTTVFAMQGLGLVVGPAVTLAIEALGLPPGMAWRLLLLLGAVPALAAFWLRQGMAETPRYTLHVQGDVQQTADIVQRVTSRAVAATASPAPSATLRPQLRDLPFLPRLISSALTWFLVDVAFYGLGLSANEVVGYLSRQAGVAETTVVNLAVFALTALPGYLVAAWQMDRLGRRFIQSLGFAAMACAYSLIGLWASRSASPQWLIPLYGASYFFVEFGPNTTTFLYPSELFPTALRGQAHGIAAAAGKLGAFASALGLPLLLPRIGLEGIFWILSALAAAGAAITQFGLPEPKRRPLEDLSQFFTSPAVHSSYSRILRSLQEDSTAYAIAAEMAALSGAEGVAVHEWEGSREELRLVAWEGDVAHLAPIIQLPSFSRASATPWGHALLLACHRREAVLCQNLPTWQGSLRASLQSMVALPLVDGQRVLGVISLWHPERDAFPAEMVGKMQLFVQVGALAWAYSRRYGEMRALAMTDGLTGLLNRRGFEDELERRCAAVPGKPAPPFAFVILDLDRFKAHNDTYGHQSGDQALAEIARHLREALAPDEMAARLGGDEFILLLAELTSPAMTKQRLARILAQIPLDRWGLGVSAGASLFPWDGTTYQMLYRVADRRLYRAKQEGGNQIVVEDTPS